MCDPISLSLAAFGLTSATAVYQHQEGVKTAERQSEALSLQEGLTQMDLERKQAQQREADAEEMNAAHRSALSDLASLDAIAGEYGGGKTAERGRAVLGVQQGETLATVGANSRKGLAEASYASIASKRNTIAQIRSIQAPSRVGTALSIANAGAQAYGSYQTQSKLNDLASKGKTQ